jgi:DGQHR domain-containing protein
MYPRAIRINLTTGVQSYLTAFSASDLERLYPRYLRIELLECPPTDRGRQIKRYARPKDEKRVNKIRRFLESQSSVIPPVLPQSIVLNVRRRFQPRVLNEDIVLLPQGLRFYVIDGQHRIFGAIEAYRQSRINTFLPATILEGLTELQETALFLLINHTQKRVEPTIRLLDAIRMLQRRRTPNSDVREFLRILGFREADLDVLVAAREQVLDESHFWFRYVQLPTGEER